MSEPTRKPVKVSKTTGRPGTRTHVGNIEIIERESAELHLPNSTETRTCKTIDRLLLADGTETFQCVYPDIECWLVFDTAHSTFAHQRTHSAKMRVKRVETELQSLRTAKSEEFTRRSNGQRVANERREQRIKQIESMGLAEALRHEAAVLEERVLWLRAMAIIAEQTDKSSLIPADELAQLRADSQQFQQLRNLLGK